MRSTIVLAALAALVAFPLAAQDPDGSKAKKPRKDPNVITLEEIEAVRDRAETAMAVIRYERPQFLRARGATSFGNTRSGRSVPYPKVVVDGVPRGEIDVLNQLPSMTVREIRYLSAADASIRFGTDYDGGAILVLTR